MSPKQRPPLIGFISDVSARTQFILPNRDHIESLPFDGMVINIPQSWSAFTAGTVHSEAEIRVWLEPLADFNAGKLNYLQINTDAPGDMFNDAAWAQVTENWRLLAKVAHDTGFTGILFDNEEYQGQWDNFPDDFPNAVPGKTMQDYRDKAVDRGAQIMAAVAQEFPEGTIGVAHGPYVSTPAGVPGFPAFPFNQSGDWSDQELSGAFFTGLLEQLGPKMHLLDGGELYMLRSAADFAQSFEYRNSVLPGAIPWQFDPVARANWAKLVDQAHIVYTAEYPSGFIQTPATIVNTLLNAFDHSEGAVFLFSDSGFGWFEPGKTPAGWISAVKRAVSLADHTTTGTIGADSMVGTALTERLNGGRGDDFINGKAGADWLQGGHGNDRLYGDLGNDDLFGSVGRDYLYGGIGNDSLAGGAGNDVLKGGLGADTFVLQSGGGVDRITDFDPSIDRIDLRGNVTGAQITDTAEGLHVSYGAAVFVLVGVHAAFDAISLI